MTTQTEARGFQTGYQKALEDMADAYLENVDSGMIDYLLDNLSVVATRELVASARRAALGPVRLRCSRTGLSHSQHWADECPDRTPEYGEHAACKHCDLDIECISNTGAQLWHDRGGNTHCPTQGAQPAPYHAPYREF